MRYRFRCPWGTNGCLPIKTQGWKGRFAGLRGKILILTDFKFLKEEAENEGSCFWFAEY